MFHEYLNGIKNIKQNCRNIALLRICALLNCPFVKCWSMLPALARLTAAIGSMKCIAQCRASTCTATPFLDAICQRCACARRGAGAGATASCRARLYSARAAHANPRWPLWDFCQRRSARAAGRADPQLSLPGAPACAPALARRGTQALAALSRPPVSAAPDAGDALDA